uniref:Uncharacterized protein n=1 Tax=Neobodo designis TaxID=312471 RepID=A0A7S1QBW5_NEODS|mmetsp:Transcript_40205/g.124235  ORF Transcript_40205/g.124235 Transcript_40205/m.124235 type:complete len:294 (+) Transcript_40205:1-882(+)
MTASFVGPPPPMDLGPAGADSFAAPPALSNESIVWNASTATQARPGPAGGAAVADRSPNMGPATLSMRNFSFAGSTFANSPPGPRGERPPTTTSSTAGDTPSGARMTRRRTSLAGADAGMAADNFEAPKALRPAPAPAPSAPSPPDSESLSCTRNEISFGEMGIRIASDDGKGTTDGDEDDGTPKLPDMPPPPSLAATVQRLNDSMAGPSSTSPPGRGDRSPGNDLSRARSVRFAPDSPKEAANKESASADRSALAPKRAASSLLANNTTPAPADTPKFGRRSTVHNLDQQRT